MTTRPDPQAPAVPDRDGQGPTVIERSHSVEVDGLTRQDALEALALLHAARRLQFELGTSAASGLLRAMSEARLELTPPAAVEQARRLAGRRRALLATPAYSYDTLREVRGDAKVSTTRTWVARMRDQHRLFTLQENGRTVIPALQLTSTGRPRPELTGMLRALLGSGVDGWSLWVWLTSSTPLLSGQTPIEVASTDTGRANRAAARFAARHRPAA